MTDQRGLRHTALLHLAKRPFIYNRVVARRREHARRDPRLEHKPPTDVRPAHLRRAIVEPGSDRSVRARSARRTRKEECIGKQGGKGKPGESRGKERGGVVGGVLHRVCVLGGYLLLVERGEGQVGISSASVKRADGRLGPPAAAADFESFGHLDTVCAWGGRLAYHVRSRRRVKGKGFTEVRKARPGLSF